MLELYENCPDFLDIYDFDLLDAKQTFHLLLRTSVPVIINESFIRYLVPEGEDPVGQPISKYVPEKSEKGTNIGVMKDFKKYSLTNNVFPLRMILHEIPHQVLISNNQEVTDFSRILLMYASISLFLTLFGLFGITHYAIQQRIREIGMRKIHGASFGQILWLVNRPFLYYIGIAFILIVPLVCYLMNYWLQQFAYHVHIGILHFLLPLFFTVCITLLTVCLNSYRAARNNPVDSIKHE